MPRRNDIKKVMVIGSGPIVVGQAAEFASTAAVQTFFLNSSTEVSSIAALNEAIASSVKYEEYLTDDADRKSTR